LEPRERGINLHPRKRHERGGATSSAVGPSPVDRGRAGTKRHQAVDKDGLPLVAVGGALNIAFSDSKTTQKYDADSSI